MKYFSILSKSINVKFCSYTLVLFLFKDVKGPKRSHKSFTYLEIVEFLGQDHAGATNYWFIRKCFAAIAFCGGLGCQEMKSLTFQCLDRTDEGWTVSSEPSSDIKPFSFLVPFRNDHGGFGVHVDNYINLVQNTLGTLEGHIFKTVLKGGGYSKVAMGINFMYLIPKEIAQVMQLEDPSRYTGISFKKAITGFSK